MAQGRYQSGPPEVLVREMNRYMPVQTMKCTDDGPMSFAQGSPVKRHRSRAAGVVGGPRRLVRAARGPSTQLEGLAARSACDTSLARLWLRLSTASRFRRRRLMSPEQCVTAVARRQSPATRRSPEVRRHTAREQGGRHTAKAWTQRASPHGYRRSMVRSAASPSWCRTGRFHPRHLVPIAVDRPKISPSLGIRLRAKETVPASVTIGWSSAVGSERRCQSSYGVHIRVDSTLRAAHRRGTGPAITPWCHGSLIGRTFVRFPHVSGPSRTKGLRDDVRGRPLPTRLLAMPAGVSGSSPASGKAWRSTT
jgi:hypothetical protein